MDNTTESTGVVVEDQAPDVIREQIQETRSALTEKLEKLEEKVMETVETVQSSVTDTVDAVKGSVQDSVEAVKRTFDLHHQAEERPWMVLGCSVLAGYVAGSLVSGRQTRKDALPMSFDGAPAAAPAFVASPPRQRRTKPRPGIFHGFLRQFGEELAVIQAEGVGALMGFIRDQLKEKMPALAPHVGKAMDSATRKLGGDPIPQHAESFQ